MIIGVGIDVVDIERFGRTLERTPGLRPRLFTTDEQRLPLPSLAARFAAKEAVAKALGAPVGLRWTDAQVHPSSGGRPHVEVRGTVAARARELGVRHWHVSLSHDAGIASAVVIAEGEPSTAVIAEGEPSTAVIAEGEPSTAVIAEGEPSAAGLGEGDPT